ncbi:MAG: inorganic diphosphatase [Bacteroidetes bacterium]|nr:MAG: inorganic diphosphatase [Bacteroidota bacterium]
MRNIASILVILLYVSCSSEQTEKESIHVVSHDFLRDFPAYTPDSLVNIVIEIPAGCNQKWEVNKETGFLEWESVNEDSLRVVRYLPYPANYGMIPQTWLPEKEGGDNDPLDVFLLGKSIERGNVIPSRIIGVIKMLDKGQQDDKLIAVPVDDWHYDIYTLEELDESYPGVIEILSAWLVNYKGPGIVELLGVSDESAATEILQKSVRSFQNSNGQIVK